MYVIASCKLPSQIISGDRELQLAITSHKRWLRVVSSKQKSWVAIVSCKWQSQVVSCDYELQVSGDHRLSVAIDRKLEVAIKSYNLQARNQDFMWGGANETKVDQTTKMYFLLSDPFI